MYISQSVTVAVLPACIFSVANGVLSIRGVGVPSEISQVVIERVVVEVTTLQSFWTRPDESFEYDSMKKFSDPLAPQSHMDHQMNPTLLDFGADPPPVSLRQILSAFAPTFVGYTDHSGPERPVSSDPVGRNPIVEDDGVTNFRHGHVPFVESLYSEGQAAGKPLFGCTALAPPSLLMVDGIEQWYLDPTKLGEEDRYYFSRTDATSHYSEKIKRAAGL